MFTARSAEIVDASGMVIVGFGFEVFHPTSTSFSGIGAHIRREAVAHFADVIRAMWLPWLRS